MLLHERLKEWAYPAPTNRIFGIGLNKTGTRSLAAALREVGLRTMHSGDAATSSAVDRAIASGLRPLEIIGERFDAYLDINAVVRRYAEIDTAYPGSRFILTTCGLDDWLASRRRHVLANVERSDRGEYAGGFVTTDEEAWIEEWNNHHDSVLAYFAQRPHDLLVLDIRSGEGWEKLAPFLGVRAPRDRFPWENRRGQGTYRPKHAHSRAVSRVRMLKGIMWRRVGLKDSTH